MCQRTRGYWDQPWNHSGHLAPCTICPRHTRTRFGYSVLYNRSSNLGLWCRYREHTARTVSPVSDRRVDPNIANDFAQCIFQLGQKYDPGNFGGSSSGSTSSGSVVRQSLKTTASADPAQKIGLLEFDTFNSSDVENWLELMGFPTSIMSQLSEVPVNGGVGSPRAGESEVLVDIDTAIGMALSTSTKYVVYDAPPSTSFETMFNTMINDGDTVISNSWSQCEDETPLSDAQAINSVLSQAAASGITVVNGTGDTGSTCADGSANTVGVPSDSPNATAVGGTSPSNGGEVWWNGSSDVPPSGEGGFGVSQDFPRPSYQNGLTSTSGRSVPDIAVDADPAAGIQICQADDGGCPSGLTWGGTSMAAPEVAALVAYLNQELGYNVGDLNAAIYPLTGTASFNKISGATGDFTHVGLGSPNFTAIFQALKSMPTGPVSASGSQVFGLGSSADGKTQGFVQANLLDANGFPVVGQTVTFTASPGCQATIAPPNGPSDSSGTVVSVVTDTTPERCTFTATDTTDGITLSQQPTIIFSPPTATGAQIYGGPAQVNNDGTSQATITVYLENNLNQPASGKTVTLSEGSGGAVITPAGSATPGTTAITNSAGNAVFIATDTNAEAVNFTATDTTDGNLPVPGSVSVSFAPSTATCPTALPTAASGYSVSAFATDVTYNTEGGIFPGNVTENACITGSAPAFDSSGDAYIADTNDGTIHVLPPSGGALTAANQLPDASFPPDSIGQLVFGPDGSLYAGLINLTTDITGPEIVQLDPTTGATIRVIASTANGLPDCPYIMAVDPLSGDLFTDDECSGYAASNQISRIGDPSGANPTVSAYYTTGGCNLGLTFAPNGTLYLANCNGEVDAITGNEHRHPD